MLPSAEPDWRTMLLGPVDFTVDESMFRSWLLPVTVLTLLSWDRRAFWSESCGFALLLLVVLLCKTCLCCVETAFCMREAFLIQMRHNQYLFKL